MRAVRPDSESRGVDDGGALQIEAGPVTLDAQSYAMGLPTLGRGVAFAQLLPHVRSFTASHLRGPGVVLLLPAPFATTCLRVSAVADLGEAVSGALIAAEGPLGRQYPDPRVAFLGTATLGEAEKIAWATLATFAIEAA